MLTADSGRPIAPSRTERLAPWPAGLHQGANQLCRLDDWAEQHCSRMSCSPSMDQAPGLYAADRPIRPHSFVACYHRGIGMIDG
jgi:hypothetical protein